MVRNTLNRRTLLKVGGVGVISITAGCLGDDGVDRDAPPEDQIEQHLEDANGWDGTIEDFRGESEITVLNGDEGTNYVFDPAAVRIDAGTTVIWEWVGGATHTVTDEYDDAFDSGRISGGGETWSHTFADSGVYLYICEPHRNFQRGAVLVE